MAIPQLKQSMTTEEMDKFLNAQLEKLKTNYINYYLVHSLTGDLWDKVDKLSVTDFLDKVKADGRIINAGFSFHGTAEDFKRIIDAYAWEFCRQCGASVRDLRQLELSLG